MNWFVRKAEHLLARFFMTPDLHFLICGCGKYEESEL